jgi:hypothetical protein
MMRQGFEVRRDGRLAGELFEGAGPFVSTAQLAGPNPIFCCAFVSRSERDEAAIARALGAAKDLDGARRALVAAGFELTAIEDPDRLEPSLPIDTPRSPFGGFRG